MDSEYVMPDPIRYQNDEMADFELFPEPILATSMTFYEIIMFGAEQ